MSEPIFQGKMREKKEKESVIFMLKFFTGLVLKYVSCAAEERYQ